VRSVVARALHGVVTAVAYIRNTARLESRAHFGAVTVSECMIHDRGGQTVVRSQNECVAYRGRCDLSPENSSRFG
jgi:hypothetical protein